MFFQGWKALQPNWSPPSDLPPTHILEGVAQKKKENNLAELHFQVKIV